MRSSRRAWAAMGLGAILLVASCGSPPAPVNQSAVPPAATTNAPTTAPPTPTPTPAPSATPSASATNGGATPDGPPIVMASPGSGKQELVLADAFDRGRWSEGSFTPANETDAIRAMATTVDCYTSQPRMLEYRFAQVQGRIVVQVAQDMRSDSPDVEIEFSLTADGRQVAVQNANFTDKPELSAELSGVTVLRIGAKTAPGTRRQCNGEANALVTSVVVEQ
ncbi:MAG: hypothetical protein Q4F67_07515 [Propionibacteriaceae bacterium]|nr:hypothetical protein [Propionibacteriaceae bacterium]